MKYYKHKPLAKDAIRLIKIESGPELSLSLQHYNSYISSGVEYIALSYCWGDGKDKCDISIEGRKFQITSNLRSALERIHLLHRGLKQFPVWIDQICIDQKNVSERNEQVQQMWRIFSTAVHVYAWLGHAGGIGGNSSFPQYSNAIEASALIRQADVVALLNTSYFTRAWIVPEILQARSLTFLFGSQDGSADRLKAELAGMIQAGWKQDVQKLVKIKILLELRGQSDLAVIFGRAMPERSIFVSALELLHDTSCSDIRDKIFAALSIPCLTAQKQMSTLRPDYLLSPNELVVITIAYFDILQGNFGNTIGELSRTLSRSLGLGDGTNTTEAYEANIVASISSCTRRWSDGTPLVLKSGTNIGSPGPFLRYYLLKSIGRQDANKIFESTSLEDRRIVSWLATEHS